MTRARQYSMLKALADVKQVATDLSSDPISAELGMYPSEHWVTEQLEEAARRHGWSLAKLYEKFRQRMGDRWMFENWPIG